MTTRQKLILNMIAQLALFVLVGWVSFHVYHSPHVWGVIKLALVALYAFQILMTLRAGKAVWRAL